MQLLIRIQKSDFLKKTEKFLEFILGVLLHPLGATFFFYSNDFDTNWYPGSCECPDAIFKLKKKIQYVI